MVEPLAKTGQLQVVVATTGLAAGINFSMRSVLVTDREYRTDEGVFLLRPDELLQMFGRAGRRGLDDRGYIIVAPKQARMADARPLKLKRSSTLDWPALIRIMGDAVKKENHVEAARWLAQRLSQIKRFIWVFVIPYLISSIKNAKRNQKKLRSKKVMNEIMLREMRIRCTWEKRR